jgi:hypothetical protein
MRIVSKDFSVFFDKDMTIAQIKHATLEKEKLLFIFIKQKSTYPSLCKHISSNEESNKTE